MIHYKNKKQLILAFVLVVTASSSWAMQPIEDEELETHYAQDGIEIQNEYKGQADSLTYANTITGGKLTASQITWGAPVDLSNSSLKSTTSGTSVAFTAYTWGLNLDGAFTQGSSTNAAVGISQSTNSSFTIYPFVMLQDTPTTALAKKGEIYYYSTNPAGASSQVALPPGGSAVFNQYGQRLYISATTGKLTTVSSGNTAATISNMTANVGGILQATVGHRQYDASLGDTYTVSGSTYTDFADNLKTSTTTARISINGDNSVQVDMDDSTSSLYVKGTQIGASGTSVGAVYVKELNLQDQSYNLSTPSTETDSFRVVQDAKTRIKELRYINTFAVTATDVKGDGDDANGDGKTDDVQLSQIKLKGITWANSDIATQAVLSNYSYNVSDTEFAAMGTVHTDSTLVLNDQGEIEITTAATDPAVKNSLLIEQIQFGPELSNLGAVLIDDIQSGAGLTTVTTAHPDDLPAELGEIGDALTVTVNKKQMISTLKYFNTKNNASIQLSSIVTGLIPVDYNNSCGAGCALDFTLGTADHSIDSAEFTDEVQNGTATNTFYMDANNHARLALSGQNDFFVQDADFGSTQTAEGAGSFYIGNMQNNGSHMEFYSFK